jgi:hypothetical protein
MCSTMNVDNPMPVLRQKSIFVQENLTMPLSHLYNVQEFITDKFFIKFIIVLTLSAVVITPAP